MQTSSFPDSIDELCRLPHLGHKTRGGYAEVGWAQLPADCSSFLQALLRRVTPKCRWYLPLKRVAEWALALALFVALAPLILFLAVLVRCTSSGPAFYTQSRLGLGGRQFRIYKLRTMTHDCERSTGPVWAAKGDTRITPVGRILRDTHLDELPQLLNVLRGEMALIGPRPERPELSSRICQDMPEFELRLRVRPGITGLAQMLLPADDPDDVGLRGVRHKLAHDLLYVRDVSPLLDLRIAMSTSCYFTSAAIDAVRQSLVRPCGTAVRGNPLTDELVAPLIASEHA